VSDEETPGAGGSGGMDLSSIFQQAQNIQKRMKEAQEAVADMTVEGNAGGGMVVVQATGAGTITRVSIESVLWESGDREMTEDLVAAAVNQALLKAKQASQDQLSNLTGGLPIPPGLLNMF